MLTGYTDRLTARPNERLSFMVSTDAEAFDVELVRLFHGDADPRGPGLRETIIPSPLSGRREGHEQPLSPGSYVVVPDGEALRLAHDFTLFGWVCPTRLGGGDQLIMSKAGEDGAGYSLGVTREGRLFLSLGASRIEGERPLRQGRWHWFAADYELKTGAARIRAGFHASDLSRASDIGGAGPLAPARPAEGPLIIAASSEGGRVRGFLNGRLADLRIFGRVLGASEVRAMVEDPGLSLLPQPCIAAWDFSIAPSGSQVHDLGVHALHGETRQMPIRAVLGPHWSGECDDPARDPRAYSAIHFHEDSLVDAGWKESFALDLPADLASGVYAARLSTSGERDYLPFLVAPPRGRGAAPIAFLAPSFTYLAYGNELGGDYGLNCVYDSYVDGAGTPLASALHPLKMFRPGRGMLKSVSGDAFARHLCADLYFIDWLNAIGQPIDIITDHILHDEGVEVLRRYKGVCTGSHPEYVSAAMLDSLEAYLSGGGSLAYLGGNGFYSVTSLSRDGAVIEVRRPNGSRPWTSRPGEGCHAMTGEIGGLWRFRGRPPQRLVGVGFTAQGWTAQNECGPPRPYRQQGDRSDPLAAEILKGVGEDELIGDFETLGLGVGAAGDEIDRADPALGTPLQAVVLASATGFAAEYPLVLEERQDINMSSTVPGDPLVRSDLVCFETGQGGFVVSVSSMQWFSALYYNGGDNNVARITHNVIGRMLSPVPPPG